MQLQFQLAPRSRGFHLVTDEVCRQLPSLNELGSGVCHLFIQHSSASLTLNENADPTVRADMERYLLQQVPDDAPYFEHTLEGPDDMPAHIKASLLGSSVSIPYADGRLLLGTWQGIWLGEHRINAPGRRLVATLA